MRIYLYGHKIIPRQSPYRFRRNKYFVFGWLRLQGFPTFEFTKMIVEFSRNGGDLGVTERFLRTGCRLEARPDNSNFSFTEGIVAGVNIDVSLECMSIPKSMSVSVNIRKFAVSLMVEACDRELDYMTWTYYKQKAECPPERPPP